MTAWPSNTVFNGQLGLRHEDGLELKIVSESWRYNALPLYLCLMSVTKTESVGLHV